MAYSLSARFPSAPKYFTLPDPGSYSQGDKNRRKNNAVPFLSKTPRITGIGAKVWTQAVYDQSLPSHIPNCSSMLSKKPRFPYEAFSAEDLEEILCKCGISPPCECPSGKKIKEDVVCQGKVKRRLFKGPAPRSVLGDDGLSTPARNDHGFNIKPDGAQHRMRDEIKEEGPPFYDARVIEATAFYQGWKWGKRTAKGQKKVREGPGPADYFFEREPTIYEICAEKVRALKRKTTKQLRFMEMVQQRNILENRPSPATYSPMLPKGTDLQFIGPKAKRFPNPKSKYDISPGPADHWLRRDFDAIIPPDVLCHAKLPEPVYFGVKANRFKTQCDEGPSPATYHVNMRLCNFVKCPNAPFGSSTKRFKQETIEESDDDDIVGPLDKENEACILPTWEFKSKTIRMKPLLKKLDEPSPADLPQTRISKEKSSQLQSPVPFSSSEARLMPWHSWIPVHGILDTPGPGYYCLQKPRCFPAFKRGPLNRAKRFPDMCHKAPPPNEYEVYNGIETILATHNNKLKYNIEHQYKFKWEQPKPKRVLSLEEREKLLLNECLSLLNTDEEEDKQEEYKQEDVSVIQKPKMLRSFLYAYPVPIAN